MHLSRLGVLVLSLPACMCGPPTLLEPCTTDAQCAGGVCEVGICTTTLNATPDAGTFRTDAGTSVARDGGSAAVDDAGGPPVTDAGQPPCPGNPPLTSTCEDTAADLRACFTFDVDDSGGSSVTDESGNGNTGALANGASLGAGRTGLGLVLTPTDDQMLVQESASIDTPQFTIDAWVFANQLPTGRMAIADYDGQWGFFANSTGNLSCRSTSGGTLAVGRWVHLACTVDGTSARILVDGVEVASDPNGNVNTGAAGPLAIGSNAPNGDAFDGVLDDVRIWSRALNDDELCWLSTP